VSCPGRTLPLERPGTHCTRGWVGLRVGLDRCGKSRPNGIRSPDRPARRQSLYRLRYPAHKKLIYIIYILIYIFDANSIEDVSYRLCRLSRSCRRLKDHVALIFEEGNAILRNVETTRPATQQHSSATHKTPPCDKQMSRNEVATGECAVGCWALLSSQACCYGRVCCRLLGATQFTGMLLRSSVL